MATFEVKIVEIDDIVDHPNANRLTVVTIGGYTCIANKLDDGTWRYVAGDLVAYIPSQAILPESLLRLMGFWDDDAGKGFLAGPDGNRVHPIKLRGIYSEGVLLPIRAVREYCPTAVFGDDVTNALGITKYVPVMPDCMDGTAFFVDGFKMDYDLEPIEAHMALFDPDEEVVMTEKLHGTFTGITIMAGLDAAKAFPSPSGDRNVLVYSKGLGAQGMAFQDVPSNEYNIYVKAWHDLNNAALWEYVEDMFTIGYDAVHILGETFGPGVQDLHYGRVVKEFRVFAIGFSFSDGSPDITWLSPLGLPGAVTEIGAESVPVLYKGPFNHEVVVKHRDGKTTFDDHVREGTVITSASGRIDPFFGPVRVKAVSPRYKLRRNGTEYT